MRVGRVSGSLYGRAVGVAMCYMWQSVTGTPYPTGMWRWIDPGVTAAVGAAGLLGGVNRIATASTVIVVRIPLFYFYASRPKGGSVAEWLVCWTQAQKGPGSNHSRDAVG